MLVLQFAILFLYQRLFWVVDWFRRSCYVLMALVVAWSIATLVGELTICAPTRKLWNPKSPGKCGDTHKLCLSTGMLHASFDLAILSIPMPLVWKLKISVGNKVFLTFLLLCGIL